MAGEACGTDDVAVSEVRHTSDCGGTKEMVAGSIQFGILNDTP